jgi:hypothetical protein
MYIPRILHDFNPNKKRDTNDHGYDEELSFKTVMIHNSSSNVLQLKPSAHMQFSFERLLADSCERSWRTNNCRGTCTHIQFRVVHNYANDQSISCTVAAWMCTIQQ